MRTSSRIHSILASIFLLANTSYADGQRAFVNQDGQVILAELVSHPGAESGKVVIMKNGEEFLIEISIFREEDQEFIKKWISKTPASVEYKMNISATKTKESKDTFAFKVEVENDGKESLSEFKIKYRVYMKNSMGKTVFREHDLDVAGPLAENKVAKLTTESFNPDVMILKTKNGTSVSTTSSNTFDTKKMGMSSLLGVLVRVYDKHGRIIEDWRSSGTNFKSDWPAPKTDNKKQQAKPKPAVTIE